VWWPGSARIVLSGACDADLGVGAAGAVDDAAPGDDAALGEDAAANSVEA
jgi:hypothetical protein